MARTHTLAGTRAAQAGPLHEFKLTKTTSPHPFEILDLYTRARAHGAGNRAWWQRILLGCLTHDPHGQVGGHA